MVGFLPVIGTGVGSSPPLFGNTHSLFTGRRNFKGKITGSHKIHDQSNRYCPANPRKIYGFALKFILQAPYESLCADLRWSYFDLNLGPDPRKFFERIKFRNAYSSPVNLPPLSHAFSGSLLRISHFILANSL